MQFAVFTGNPKFSIPQRTNEPLIEEETKQRFHRLAEESFTTNRPDGDGPLARRLEEAIAERHAVAHAVAAASDTIAQMLLLKAMGVERGEALVAANAPVSFAHACSWQGIRPVFCDIAPSCLNMDPAEVERKLTDNTVAVIPTHLFGVFADMETFRALCRRKRLLLLADAAHAFDCDAAGIRAGGGEAPEVLSLHAREFFSTVEGGAVVTNDPALARELRHLRRLGLDHSGQNVGIGINAVMSEIHAAFGLASLPALEQRRERLGSVREIYCRSLSDLPGVTVYPLDASGGNNHRHFALRLDESFGVPRDAVREILRRDNVLTQPSFQHGCHHMRPYSERGEDALPRVEAELARLLCLPTSFAECEPREAPQTVADLLHGIHEHATELAEWWEKERGKRTSKKSLKATEDHRE